MSQIASTPTPVPPSVWDESVAVHSAAHILQTSLWSALKAQFGWDDERVPLNEGKRILAGAQILYRRLPFGLGRLAYVPKGPLVDWAEAEQAHALLAALDHAARARGAIALTLEPDLPDEAQHNERLTALGFRPAPFSSVQPRHTLVVDISGRLFVPRGWARLLLVEVEGEPVELSVSPAFRRRFSMVYDALCQRQIDPEAARALLAAAEPTDAIQVAGCAVYPVDSTPHPRPDAETLPDRGNVYSTCKEGTVQGHQYSWLGRVIAQGQSWFAPRDIERVATNTTPAAVAAQADKRNPRPAGRRGRTTINPPTRLLADSLLR